MRFLFRTVVSVMMVAGFFTLSTEMKAQRVGFKTNALYWAGLSPNMGVEFRLSRTVTLNVEADGSIFKISKYQLYHANFAPEVRYWLSGRPLARHFVGGMGLFSAYKYRFGGDLHDGQGVGAGLTYGHAFVLGERWSMEATVGAGVIRYWEKQFDPQNPLPYSYGANHKGFAFVPLKLGVSFTYLLK